MLAALALVVALHQGQTAFVVGEVDRSRVMVGDGITWTVRAEARAAELMSVVVPAPDGFEVIARSERTEVSVVGVETRTIVVELRLVARRPGKWILGPAEIRLGGRVQFGGAVEVEVMDNRALTGSVLSPRARALLDRAVPPAAGGVSLTVLVPRNTAQIGEQVDIVTAAWFPRELRLRLRRPPTLQPPSLDGMWTYPQAAPVGIAASRVVGGQWYDLFVLSQVGFPLHAGPLRIGGATLTYSVPVGIQFYGQEERRSLSAQPVDLTITPLPDAGRPPRYAGATGAGMSIDREPISGPVHQGRPFAVSFVVKGEGNVSLWPSPVIDWPVGIRAYPDRVDETITPVEGRIAGSKTFRFLVVADSPGVASLPAVQYPVWDVTRRVYVTLQVPGGVVVVQPSAALADVPAEPLPLLAPAGLPLALRATRALGPGGIGLLALLPPVVALWLWRRRPRHRAVPRAAEAPSIALERRITGLLAGRDDGPRGNVVDAVLAAGYPDAVAERVGTFWPRLLAARYAPGNGDRASLDGEAAEILAMLERQRAPTVSRPRTLAVGLAVLAVATQGAPAAREAVELYRRGDYHAAAVAFERAVAQEPGDPALLYGLGAARRMDGDRGGAIAAWVQARRLSPRTPEIRRAMAGAPAADLTSDELLAVPPVTAPELALVALTLWAAAWAVVGATKGRRKGLAAALGMAAVVAATWGAMIERRNSQPLVIGRGSATIRLSPHERAPGIGGIALGTVLRLEGERGAWRLVAAPSGLKGWVPAEAVRRVGT